MELGIVTFEQAKALKEFGFPINCTSLYYTNDGERYDWNQIESWHNKYYDKNPAPTLELAAKWLREEKDIIIQPCAVDTDDYLLKLLVREYDSYDECYTLSNKMYELVHYNSYEEALSAGIDKAIEFLTNKKY